MSLARLLEINRQLIRREAFHSLELAERMWIVRGEPQDSDELAEFLEAVLTRCLELEIRYAPILLQRKKALERGAWRPRRERPLAALPAAIAPSAGCSSEPNRAPAPIAGSLPEACSRCNGRGTYVEAGMSRLCPCGAFLASAKSLAPVDRNKTAV